MSLEGPFTLQKEHSGGYCINKKRFLSRIICLNGPFCYVNGPFKQEKRGESKIHYSSQTPPNQSSCSRTDSTKSRMNCWSLSTRLQAWTSRLQTGHGESFCSTSIPTLISLSCEEHLRAPVVHQQVRFFSGQDLPFLFTFIVFVQNALTGDSVACPALFTARCVVIYQRTVRKKFHHPVYRDFLVAVFRKDVGKKPFPFEIVRGDVIGQSRVSAGQT